MSKEEKGTGKPRGKSLRRTAKQIEELSKVGPQDMAAANSYFRRFAPEKFKTLLGSKKNK